MNSIVNYEDYNSAMAKTLADKCWWLNEIPANINTIIDFGCADGALFRFIHKSFPNRFRFIGVDNNEAMLIKAAENANKYGYKVNLHTSISSIPADYRKNAVLLLNSVIHEILNYYTYWESQELFDQFEHSGIAYIAIRDMYQHDDVPAFHYTIPNNEASKEKEVAEKIGHTNPVAHILEFMLKAEYDSNWEREVEERYLWRWAHWFYGMTNYHILYEENFSLAYHRRLWRKKYQIPSVELQNIKTHKKMLLKLI